MQLIKIFNESRSLFIKKHCVQHAAGLAFNTSLSIMPLLVICSWVVVNIPGLEQYVSNVQDFLLSHFINSTGAVIKKTLFLMLQQVKATPKFEIFLISIVLWMFWQNIDKVFNYLYDTDSHCYSWIKSSIMSVVLLLIPASVAFGFAIGALLDADIEIIHAIAVKIPYLVDFLFGTLGIGLLFVLFKFMPNQFVSFKISFYVSVFVYCGLEFANNMLTWYFNQYHFYYMIYGAYSALPVFLLWLFVAWLIILFGACVVKVLS